MNKFLILGLSVFLLLGVASAIYIVNSFSIEVDIAEPFEVSYAILGDAGHSDWQKENCSEIPIESFVDLSEGEGPVDFSYIYAGENREFCVKIINSAEVPLGYVVSGEVRTGLGNSNECAIAFSNLTSLEANVNGGETIIASKPIHISAESPVVDGCVLDISVARTETFT